MNALEWTPPHPIYDMPDPSTMAPLERACFELAKKAHEGQVRNKPVDPKPPYIIHPVIAFKVMKAAGVKDWITTGSAFVHDCLEQGEIDGKKLALKSQVAKFDEVKVRDQFKKYYDEPGWVPLAVKNLEWVENFYKNLVNKVIDFLRGEEKIHFEDCIANYADQTLSKGTTIPQEKRSKVIDVFSSFVATVVNEVSNSSDADNWITNKRLEQIQKTSHLSQRAKEVKMADFAASLIDDLIIFPKKSPNDHRRFVSRAWDVTKKCWDANPVLGEVVHILRDMNLERLKMTPEEAEEKAKNFDLDKIVEKARQNVQYNRAVDDSYWIDRDSEQAKSFSAQKSELGIENIKLRNGFIVKYRTVIDPLSTNDSPVNQAVWKLVDNLESGHNAVYTGSIGISPSYDIVIKMKLREPMKVKPFVASALAAHSMTENFAEEIKKTVKLRGTPKTDIIPADARLHMLASYTNQRSGW